MIDLRDLLKRIRQWDALDIPNTDGAYWKREIDAALKQPEQEHAGAFNDGVLEGMLRERAYWLRQPERATVKESLTTGEQPEQNPGSVCARCGGWVCDPVIPQPPQPDPPASPTPPPGPHP